METIMASVLIFNLVLLAAILSVYSFLHWLLSTKLPASLPWIGLRDEIFSSVRANLREYTAGFRTIREGYSKYNKHDRPFVIPDPSFQEQVMLPTSQLQWFSTQPDSRLSERMVKSKRFAFRYLAATLNYHNEELVMAAIRKDFLRNLPNVQPILFEDMKRSIDQLFGLSTKEWTDVCMWKAMENVILSSTNRIFFGPELSENEEYIRFSAWFAFWLGLGGVVVGSLIPSIIRPIVGYMAAVPVYHFRNKSLRYLGPLVARRMEEMKRHKSDKSVDSKMPNDLVTWIMERVLSSDDGATSTPAIISEQLLFFTLGATHTTITTSTNIMFDMLSSPREWRVYENLREEIESVFTTPDAWYNPASLKQLPKTESTIRETLRVNPVITRVVMREVMAPDGVTLPDGNHLPQGAWAGATAMGVHGDENLYPNPDQYQPFRFVPKLASSNSSTDVSKEGLPERKPPSIATINENFLSFGLGRHACPGRFFVAHQMKLLFAYIIMNYDVQPFDHRPQNKIYGDSYVPSQTATIRVRRREPGYSSTGVAY